MQKGFTLVEVLVAAAIFLAISLAIYEAYSTTLRVVRIARVQSAAIALANEQFEIARNMPYSDVGIDGGLPSGKIPHIQVLTRDGHTFTVETTVRNIDDPFDGTIGGAPNDLSPADYRLVEVLVSCDTCFDFSPLTLSTWVAPLALETSSNNGALFVRIFDAVGQPVPQASVHIENNQAAPSFVIDDETNNDGILQIVDAPPGANSYEVTVTKDGYSSEQTYAIGGVGNPNPTKPHLTVLIGQLTQTSLSIDRMSEFQISSLESSCVSAGSVDFDLMGSKLIGTGPDVLKYEASHTTNGGGNLTLSDIEWDTYSLALTDGTYDLAGTIPLTPLAVSPNSIVDFALIVAPKDPNSVLVTVSDSGSQLPISDASVRLEGGGYDTTLETGRGFFGQTSWEDGPGQTDFTDTERFFDSDGNIEYAAVAGEFKLKQAFGEYFADGQLESSTFDTGTTSNFHQIVWSPQNQPPDAGADSVKFQVATNNDSVTWNFIGPDGTGGTYYTLADQNLHASHGGDRYVRYRAYLETASTTWTPTISDVSFSFTSACTPPGQVLFSGLSSGSYDLTVTRSGYQTYSGTVSATVPWQRIDVVLSP